MSAIGGGSPRRGDEGRHGRAGERVRRDEVARARRRSLELIEEVLRSAWALESVMQSLLGELSEVASPGETVAPALLEMVIGSVAPAVEAAGERESRVATALVASIRDRVLTDLHAAAERGRER